jgi:hypothetical protein
MRWSTCTSCEGNVAKRLARIIHQRRQTGARAAGIERVNDVGGVCERGRGSGGGVGGARCWILALGTDGDSAARGAGIESSAGIAAPELRTGRRADKC